MAHFRHLLSALPGLLLATPLLFAQEPTLLQPGQKAPDFASLAQDGKEVRLSDYAGKVVVLDFWATWCGPCIASMPHLQEVAKAHASDVVVLAVCTSDTKAKYTKWVEEKAAGFPNLHFLCDPNERGSNSFDQRASQALYHVAALPTKFVVGKDGVITASIVGNEENDARLEAGLARAGLAIDAAVVARGEAQTKANAEREAAEKKRLADNPPPPFWPAFGSIQHGQAMPDMTLQGADGKPFSLSSLRGKPVVIGWGWEESLPRQVLNEIQSTFAAYGVQCVGAMVMTEQAFFDEWKTKHASDVHFRLGWDPAAKYTDANGNSTDESRAAWDKVAVIRRYFQGNMLPAMPAFVVCDGEQKLLGAFSAKNWQEAMGHLLQKAGVQLAPEHQPKTKLSAEAFAQPKPRVAEAKVEMLAVGQKAKDFDMVDVDGKPVHLADYAGKVVVLDFWATWCGPCVAAMPHVQELADHYADQGVVVIASCTSDERKKFDAWVEKHEQDYPSIRFAFDPKEKAADRASRALYGVSGIPQQFVIDKNGVVVAEVGGYLKGEVLLDAALAKAGVKVDDAVLEKAKQDQAARDARKTQTKPAIPMKPVPMKPMTPGGGMVPAEPVDGGKK